MNCNCAICQNNKPFELPKGIIEAVSNDDLVLFCGAGISTENKNVLPYTFYSDIKHELQITDDTISFSKLMQKYCDEPNGRRKMLRKIYERFQYIDSFPELNRRATAFHRELSEIYMIRTIITTNWDTYFEEHCNAIPITIPEDFAFWDDKSRYVLKIHGSVNNVSSIIATTEDYEKCFHSLQNGIIGATLKNIIATKTVVFIGFSFGDEDFSQIINYLHTEMGELYPHIYIVTLDETIKERLEYKNSTIIITDGTYFLHELKQELYQLGMITNLNCHATITEALNMMLECHKVYSKIDIKKYPCAIYNLSYQDGVIHAFERFLNTYSTGEYNQPGRTSAIVKEYDLMIKDFHKNKNFVDEAYYEGYMNGLILIEACDDSHDVIEYFPFLYLPNAKQPLTTYDVFMKELERVSLSKDQYQKYAKSITNKFSGDDIVIHHPPF